MSVRPPLMRQGSTVGPVGRSRGRTISSQAATAEFAATLKKLQDIYETQVHQLLFEAQSLRRALSKQEGTSTSHAEDGPNDEQEEDDVSVLDVADVEQFSLWPEWMAGQDTINGISSDIFADREYALAERKLKLKPDLNASYSSSALHQQQHCTCTCKLTDLVISPISPQRMFWDILGVVFLIYDMIWIPVQVFSPNRHVVTDALDLTVAVYWTLDILGTFFTGFYSRKGELIRTHKEIALHYLKRWFFLDVMIVSVDWIFMSASLGEEDDSVMDNAEGSGLARLGKVIRVARILRTLRLLRLMKLRHIFFAIQERIDSEAVFILVGTVKNLLVLLFVNHVFACLWYLIGVLGEGGPREEHWVFYYDTGETVIEKYMLSLHWSLTQFTPAGIEIHPCNVYERVFNVGLILIAMVGFSSFVSAITASMTRLRSLQGNELSEAFLLRRFLKENHISADLQSRVVRYIDMAIEVNRKKIDKSRVASLNMLSGPLRVELQKELYLPSLVIHKFFVKYAHNDAAINQICFKAVEKMNLSRSDVLFQLHGGSHSMFFLTSGSTYYQRPKNSPAWEAHQRRARKLAANPLFNRVLTLSKDSYFCEHSLWLPWTHRGTMGALTDSELLALDSAKFRQITTEYKDIFQSSKAYALQFVHDLEEFSDTHGCAWDLPKEVTHPKSYHMDAPILKSTLEQKQLEELKMSELLAACIEDDLDQEAASTSKSMRHTPSNASASDQVSSMAEGSFALGHPGVPSRRPRQPSTLSNEFAETRL
mmetsp:Transcript_1421/g.3294  ORF Transcript_1421/g.3294 Transcript_1421/m.3294 type:complete len:767 (-) Transcript_1421:227-2527(-)